MKFRDNCNPGDAFRTIDPSFLYQNKHGQIPSRFVEEVIKTKELMVGKTVIRILICYPASITRAEWEDHFINWTPRRSTRTNPNALDGYIDILVDGRNAEAFFGKERVENFVQVRSQASLFEKAYTKIDERVNELDAMDESDQL